MKKSDKIFWVNITMLSITSAHAIKLNNLVGLCVAILVFGILITINVSATNESN